MADGEHGARGGLAKLGGLAEESEILSEGPVAEGAAGGVGGGKRKEPPTDARELAEELLDLSGTRPAKQVEVGDGAGEGTEVWSLVCGIGGRPPKAPRASRSADERPLVPPPELLRPQAAEGGEGGGDDDGLLGEIVGATLLRLHQGRSPQDPLGAASSSSAGTSHLPAVSLVTDERIVEAIGPQPMTYLEIAERLGLDLTASETIGPSGDFTKSSAYYLLRTHLGSIMARGGTPIRPGPPRGALHYATFYRRAEGEGGPACTWGQDGAPLDTVTMERLDSVLGYERVTVQQLAEKLGYNMDSDAVRKWDPKAGRYGFKDSKAFSRIGTLLRRYKKLYPNRVLKEHRPVKTGKGGTAPSTWRKLRPGEVPPPAPPRPKGGGKGEAGEEGGGAPGPGPALPQILPPPPPEGAPLPIRGARALAAVAESFGPPPPPAVPGPSNGQLADPPFAGVHGPA